MVINILLLDFRTRNENPWCLPTTIIHIVYCKPYKTGHLYTALHSQSKNKRTSRGNTMKKAVGYVRVSTKRQSREGVSLETQKDKIRVWASMNDYELIGIEEDPGYSGGGIDNREGLQRAMDIACE